METMKADLRLAFEPPQDESVQRPAFLKLKQGRMSMLEYIHCARHLISCITTPPMDMATQVPVFVYGMNAGYQRFDLTRETPSTSEEAFANSTPLELQCLNRRLNPWRSIPFVTTMDGEARRHPRDGRALRLATHVRWTASAVVCLGIARLCAAPQHQWWRTSRSKTTSPLLVKQNGDNPDEQWLERDEVIERGLPEADEHVFPHVVERSLPRAVEDEFPRVIE
ncbi:hypothetical protein PI124_g13249 [Phytophthora idaei]|nr:hypothetical protein PI125_g12924 [Phytophthora idaei]KAG3160624.1 hypothetical protein PI126_g6798 [Phytophthora idaei]KAG3241897.1 hypothetical protein PI124_g13249 [Phytophthora idaei]